MMTTRALILAAGRGSRLGNLTLDRPKCLTVLAGRTLLDWQLAALRGAGIEDIAIVTGYRSELLEGRGLRTIHNPRWTETNMVASAVCAANWLEAGATVISYSDIVYGPAVVRRLLESPDDVAITFDRAWLTLWSLRFDEPLSDAETFREDHGRLVAIGARPGALADVQGQYMGLLRCTPAGWERARTTWESEPRDRRDRLDMTGLLQRLLGRSERIGTVGVDGGWCEVDSAEDLRRYERALAGPGRWSHDWRETESGHGA